MTFCVHNIATNKRVRMHNNWSGKENIIKDLSGRKSKKGMRKIVNLEEMLFKHHSNEIGKENEVNGFWNSKSLITFVKKKKKNSNH